MAYFFKDGAGEHKPSRKQMHYHDYSATPHDDVRERAKTKATEEMLKGGENPFLRHKHDRLDDFGFRALHPSQQRDVPPPSKATLAMPPPSAIIPPRDSGNVIAPPPQNWDEAKPKRRGGEPIPDDYLRSICPPPDPQRREAIDRMEMANGEGQRHFTNRFTPDPPPKMSHKMVPPMGQKDEGVGIWGFGGLGKMSALDSRMAHPKKGKGMVRNNADDSQGDSRMGSVLAHSAGPGSHEGSPRQGGGGRGRSHHLPPMRGVEGSPRSHTSVPWDRSPRSLYYPDPLEVREPPARRPRESSLSNVGVARKTGPDRFDHLRTNANRDPSTFANYREERARESGIWNVLDHAVHTKDPYLGVGISQGRGRGGPSEVANSRTAVNVHHSGNIGLAPPGTRFPTREDTTVGASYRSHSSMY